MYYGLNTPLRSYGYTAYAKSVSPQPQFGAASMSPEEEFRRRGSATREALRRVNGDEQNPRFMEILAAEHRQRGVPLSPQMLEGFGQIIAAAKQSLERGGASGASEEAEEA